jgi:hypothetical protein
MEDLEQHARWVDAGVGVEYVPAAQVSAAMPTTFAASRVQQTRWEVGRLRILRRYGAGLLRRGGRDRIAVVADLLVPPQSALAVLNALSLGLAGRLGSRRARRVAAAAAVCQAGYVFGGLRLAGAPWRACLVIAHAPRLVLEKTMIFARAALGSGPAEFVRTPRE